MTSALENRRRRATWRACHRGMKELDILIGRYAEAKIGAYDEAGLAHFEALLEVKDPELQRWLLSPSPGDAGAFCKLIDDMRRFHGLEA